VIAPRRATRHALALKAGAAELGERAGEGDALHPAALEDKVHAFVDRAHASPDGLLGGRY
jgi:hypothetical protein